MRNKYISMLPLFLIAISFAFYSCGEKRGELKKIWYNGSYNRDFNDLNDVHVAVAQK